MSYKFENRIQMGFGNGYMERRISKNQYNLSAMHFCDLSIEDGVPDHNTLSRFRKELTQ